MHLCGRLCSATETANLSISAHFAELDNEVANNSSDHFVNTVTTFSKNENLCCPPKAGPKDMFLTASGCYFHEVIICADFKLLNKRVFDIIAVDMRNRSIYA